MTEPMVPDHAWAARAVEAATEAFESHQRRFTELQQKMEQETTTVRAKDRSLSMTFSGRGELTGMTFHGTKYRSMAPAELSHLIVETHSAGRAQSLEKLTENMGTSITGLKLGDIATGKVAPDKMLESLFGSLRGRADEMLGGRSPKKDGK